MSSTHILVELLTIMAKLRDPNTGCLWAKSRTIEQIMPSTIEEAYEVVDAIERKDYVDLKGELGDLFFQVLFYSQIMQEAGEFSLEDVLATLKDKLIARHPHVFADEKFVSVQERVQAWENLKAIERQQKYKTDNNTINNSEQVGVLSHLCLNLPSLTLAQKIGKRVSHVGFDWPDAAGSFAKIEEEVQELSEELKLLKPGVCTEKAASELGDLLFACVNLARHLNIDAEACLRKANFKFIQRFEKLEEKIKSDGQNLEALDLERMDAYWASVKKDS